MITTLAEQISLDKLPQGSGVERAFFDESDKKVLAVVRNEGKYNLYQLFPEVILVKTPNVANGGDVYPLYQGKGIAYWEGDETVYGKYSIVTYEFKSGRTRGVLFSDGGVDGPGEILVSPDGNTVCAESGSSGYYGYKVLSITSGKQLFSGQEYSYCQKWLDNSELVVREIPYFWQNTQQVFTLNVKSLEKKLVSTTRNEGIR
jgi:hypothetical protein